MRNCHRSMCDYGKTNVLCYEQIHIILTAAVIQTLLFFSATSLRLFIAIAKAYNISIKVINMNAKELIERFDKSCYRPQVNLLGKIGSIITEAAKPPGRQDALEHIKSNLRTQITLMEGLL